jgi:uncharacterized damage-inducible protein DinB
MDSPDLERLFAYDAWANREALKSIRNAGQQERPLKLIAHVIAAQRLWMARMRRDQSPMPVWPELTIDQCAAEISTLEKEWQKFLRAADLNADSSYQNTKGESFTSRIGDILTHVIMHGAYHRGQIAAAIRAASSEPAYTDFIHCVRQGFVGS